MEKIDIKIQQYLNDNQWDAALELLDSLSKLDKEEIETLREELLLWQGLGAQIVRLDQIVEYMDVSDYIFDAKDDDGSQLVLYVKGDVQYPADLYLDIYDDSVPGVEGIYSIFIDGSLVVKGSVYNFCPNTGVSLQVAGNLQADYIVGGGSLIAVSGYSTVKHAVIGFYNDGAILLNGLKCRLFWCEDDHVMYPSETTKWDSNHIDFMVIGDSEEILSLLLPDVRAELLAKIQEDFAEEVEEEGEEYISTIPIFTEYLAEYLFDTHEFETVFRLDY